MGRPPPHVHGKEGVSGSSPEEGFTDVIPICLTAVSSGDDEAAAAERSSVAACRKKLPAVVLRLMLPRRTSSGRRECLG